MNNPARKPDLFLFWSEVNERLWDGWATLCIFPFSSNLFGAISFEPVAAWNQWVDQLLRLQVGSVLPAMEHAVMRVQPVPEASADAILEEIRRSGEESLPHHTEFDTLIYPWHDAEQSVSVSRRHSASEASKVA